MSSHCFGFIIFANGLMPQLWKLWPSYNPIRICRCRSVFLLFFISHCSDTPVPAIFLRVVGRILQQASAGIFYIAPMIGCTLLLLCFHAVCMRKMFKLRISVYTSTHKMFVVLIDCLKCCTSFDKIELRVLTNTRKACCLFYWNTCSYFLR